MKIVDRSYSTKIHRPKPVIHYDPDESLLLVVTSWGLPEHAQKVVEEYQKYISAARGDVEITSPFEFLTCYPDDVNHLRIATLITNDIIYRQDNQGEYVAGVEVLGLIKNGNQISWVQVGGPALYINKKSLGVVPIVMSQDMSKDFNTLTPMPSFLLGTESMCDLKLGHFNIENDDQLFLLSSSLMPLSLLQIGKKPIDLKQITQKTTELYPEMPFWAGVISL